jgi:signal transduction histidine kinase
MLLTVVMLVMATSSQYGTMQAANTTADTTAVTTTDINKLKTQNELLQQRSRFTTGSVAMILGIVALLAFLTINSRWTRRLEIKNQQLQRERNVVVAQNKQLAIERDRAEAASKAKTSFIQSMTHEIRTPLNAINGFIQLLNMPGVEMQEAERVDCCQRIEDNAHMLTKILDDLIFISDLESNNELPPAEPCLCITIIGQALDSVSQIVAEGVKLNSECTIPEDKMVNTHPRMIHTILNKLLDNAVKFTKEGTITLRLCEEEGQLHFSVIDTGMGIPEDKKEFIFERFSKLDNFSQGIGLGLTISRMVAERLGGTLTLDTNNKQGSKFDLIIPLSQS